MIVDLGCGTGLSAQYIKEKGFDNIFGVEPNESMRKMALQKGFYIEIKSLLVGEDKIPEDYA